MYHWSVNVDILTPLTAFPRVLGFACETQCDVSYHLEGCERQHHRRHVLFKYTLAGEGVFRDAEGEHRVPEGFGFLCDITDPETAYYYPASGRAPWTFVYACLDGESAFALMRDLLARHGPIYTLPRQHGIVADMCRFEGVRQRSVELSPAEAGRLAGEIFLQLLQSKTAVADRSDDAILVRRALEAVTAHLEEKFTATDLARLLRVSREHLSRVFTAQMGISLYQYILRRKIRHACHLLKEGHLATKEIAARLGYPDPAHFTRTFRSLVGMPPQAFSRHGAIPAW